MLFALYGADRLAVRARRDALVREFAPGGPDDIAVRRLDGSQCSPDDLTTASQALTFFDTRPVIVVDDLLARFERARPTKAAADTDSGDGESPPDSDEPGNQSQEPPNPKPQSKIQNPKS